MPSRRGVKKGRRDRTGNGARLLLDGAFLQLFGDGFAGEEVDWLGGAVSAARPHLVPDRSTFTLSVWQAPSRTLRRNICQHVVFRLFLADLLQPAQQIVRVTMTNPPVPVATVYSTCWLIAVEGGNGGTIILLWGMNGCVGHDRGGLGTRLRGRGARLHSGAGAPSGPLPGFRLGHVDQTRFPVVAI